MFALNFAVRLSQVLVQVFLNSECDFKILALSSGINELSILISSFKEAMTTHFCWKVRCVKCWPLFC